MKKLFTILLLLCFKLSFSQVYQKMPQYGYDAMRMKFDSTLQIPTTCGVPTLKSNVINHGAIAFDSCNNIFYSFNPKTQTWSQINGGTGGSQDLQSVTDLGATSNHKIVLTDGVYNLINTELNNFDANVPSYKPFNSYWNEFGHIDIIFSDDFNSNFWNPSLNMVGETANFQDVTKLKIGELFMQSSGIINGTNAGVVSLRVQSGTTMPNLYFPIFGNYPQTIGDTLATLYDIRNYAGGRNYKSFVASITSDHSGNVTSYNILENTIYDFSAYSLTILYYPSGGVYDISTSQPVLTDESKMWFAKPSFQNDVVAQEHEGYIWYSNPYHIYFKVLKANGTAELGFDKMMIEIRQYD